MGWGNKRNRMQWRDGLSRTSWQDFERLLARHYQDAGYDVEHTGTAGSGRRYDGGVDLVLRRDGETTLVQCKHWNVEQVTHNAVHELLGIVETRGAQRAILVTSGEFTPAARSAASRTPRIELIDGVALRLMVGPRLIPAAREDGMPDSNAASVAWAPVAEKATDAFMDVRTGGRWRGRRRQTPEQALKELGLRLLLGLVLALVAFLFIRHQLQNIQSALVRPVARPPAAAHSMPVPTASRRSVQSQPANAAPPMTPEQLKEWERKNAEAMQVLEKTTPSVHD